MVFDFSWGELIILGAMGTYVIGKKDLPKAANMVGFQMGRVVGLLQGARTKADRFAMNNEMKALQNELRRGLRELDAVRGEIALTASSQGLVGRGLGSTLAGANRPNSSSTTSAFHQPSIPYRESSNSDNLGPQMNDSSPKVPLSNNSINYLAASSTAAQSGIQPPSSPLALAPRTHAVAAVAEEEWTKQGIGFVSQAEKGTHMRNNDQSNNTQQHSSTTSSGAIGGSFLLADIMQQTLIYDQYDRTVQEQDELLRSRVDQQLEKREKDELKKK